MPSKEQIADGATWLRCEVVFPETWDFIPSARTVTVSASGLANDIPDDFWACLEQPPTEPGQPFVPCDQPHNYEQTGTWPASAGSIEYPAAAELAAEAQRQCRPGVPAELRGCLGHRGMGSPSTLKEGTSIGRSLLHVQRGRDSRCPPGRAGQYVARPVDSRSTSSVGRTTRGGGGS